MAEQPGERMVELTQKLEQGVKDVFSSDKYRDYLNTMSKVNRYSFPWKFMGRSVNKGEKGI